MEDIRNPQIVQIILGREGQVWINIDGVCRLRVLAAKIQIDDNRINTDIRREHDDYLREKNGI